MTTSHALISVEKKQQFAGLLLLDQIISGKERIHSSMMEKNDQLVEDYLNILEKRGLLSVGEELYFEPTDKGQQVYQTLLDQQQSYTTHFDIYSHVDLEEGTFADKETDLLEEDRWEDLRVAIARFKGIDPHRMVFLAMMSSESLIANPDWKFDLAAGTLFEEMEEIVENQITEEELSYDDAQGHVSGHDVLEDMIQQGAQINQERHQEQVAREEEEARFRDEEPEETITIIEEEPVGYGYGYYNPMATLGAYAASALFIEAIWHDPYW